jgi:altronate dehydratase small subunit
MGVIRLASIDNVVVLCRTTEAGETIDLEGGPCTLDRPLQLGHKLAARAIAAGEKIVKYGVPIGSATRDIAVGEHVHLHNMQSDYLPTWTLDDDRRFQDVV